MSRVYKYAVSFPKTCVRRLSGSGVRPQKPDLTELKKKQALFQVEDEVPVFLKRGTIDSISYYGVVAGTAISFGLSMYSAYLVVQKK